MSFIDKIRFVSSRKRKREEQEKRHIRMTGVEIVDKPVVEENNKIFFILTNAILNFLVTMGTVGCFMGPFEVKLYMPVVVGAAVLIALYTAFLYYNNVIKTLGYLFGFSGFIFGIFQLRYVIKGGFGYICNHMMEFLELEFGLPIERSYDVYGTSEKFSVTISLIFIMFAVMLMFNIAISESKGFVLVFLFTFPIVQMAMYFDLKISLCFFAMYMAGFLGLFFLRNSRHYKMEGRKKKGYRQSKKKNVITYDYINDGKYTFSFVVMLFVFVLCVTLFTSVVYPQKKFSMHNQNSELKDRTRDFTERLALVGFWGMFNPNGSAGGVGRSRLGQANHVRLDYETDMIIQTPVQYGENDIYLKAYNGTFYRDEYWYTISENKDNKVKLEDYDLESNELLNLTYRLNEQYRSDFLGDYKKINLINIGATSTYEYLPSYITFSETDLFDTRNDDEIVGGVGRNYISMRTYAPLMRIESVDEFREKVKEENESEWNKVKGSGDEAARELLELEQRYSEYVKEIYLGVPEETEDAIAEFCETYGLDESSGDIVEQVAQIFEEDYEYTLLPGKTPSNKEFVDYFLSESKKGYCVYFATSATLIFRYLGIPARYAGGYVLPQSEFISGNPIREKEGDQINAEDIDAWMYLSTFDVEKYPLGVYEYEIDDSMAHAWVEVYIDGFGWIPVEVTPSSDEEEENEEEQQSGNVMNFLANNVFSQRNINNVKNATIGIFFTIIFAGIAAVVIFIIMGMFVRKRRRKSNSVEKMYRYLCKCLAFRGIKVDRVMTYKETAQRMAEAGITDVQRAERIVRIIEKKKFSKYDITKEELETMSEFVTELSIPIYRELAWYRKLVYRYIKWL